jgi:hypothetical protein
MDAAGRRFGFKKTEILRLRFLRQDFAELLFWPGSSGLASTGGSRA